MSGLRGDEVSDADGPALSYRIAIDLIYKSVARRRSLAYGTLHDDSGKHCAIGCFWADHPGAVLYADLIDEVAAVNDSLPAGKSPKQRWKYVMRWLRQKANAMTRRHHRRAA